MTVALTKLASPGPVYCTAVWAVGVFPYMLIRENLDCFAARVNEALKFCTGRSSTERNKIIIWPEGNEEYFYFQHHPTVHGSGQLSQLLS